MSDRGSHVPFGVQIERGPQDWQIIQRSAAGMSSATGTATIDLAGTWVEPVSFKQAVVCVRVLREDDYEAVSRSLEWVRATTRKDGTWKVRLTDVPAGGLYRIETYLQVDGGPVEWGERGDMIHHLGVGDVWIIAGQSNAEGHGKSPVPDSPELGVHMFRANGCWALATHPLGDSTDTRYPANRLGATTSHSPWLAFARTLKSRLGVPIGLIPASLGGSPLSAWTRGVDGVLFDNMLDYLADADTARGLVWYQGESDASPELTRVYPQRFRRFVADLRKCLKNPRLPVITTQLNREVGVPVTDASERGRGGDDWEKMRQVQRQLAASMKNVFLLSTLDLNLSDGIHTNSAGNVVIGQRAASIALGGVYGKDVKFRHPDCRQAKRKSAKRIELRFDHVDERLYFENVIPQQFPFEVRDREGDLPIAGWSLVGTDGLRLDLSRPMQGRTVVVGAPTHFPPVIVPVDISGQRPMLAFTQPVE